MCIHAPAENANKLQLGVYAKLLKKFASSVGCKTPGETFLLELEWLSLEDRWQQNALRFWNQLRGGSPEGWSVSGRSR